MFSVITESNLENWSFKYIFPLCYLPHFRTLSVAVRSQTSLQFSGSGNMISYSFLTSSVCLGIGIEKGILEKIKLSQLMRHWYVQPRQTFECRLLWALLRSWSFPWWRALADFCRFLWYMRQLPLTFVALNPNGRCWLVSVTWEETISAEKMPPSHGPVGMSMWHCHS